MAGLGPRSLEVLGALGDTFLPSTGPGDPAGGALVVEMVPPFLSGIDPAQVKQLSIGLWLFELGAVPVFGQRFSRLSPLSRESYLRGWQTSRLAFRRQLYRALRDLCVNVYYADPRTWEHLGYAGPPLQRERAR
jgi:hypothetical protein